MKLTIPLFALLLSTGCAHHKSYDFEGGPSGVSSSKPMKAKEPSIAQFLKAYPPDAGVKPYTGDLSPELLEHADPLLVSFWRTVGLGSFGDGYLHFFHPDEYADIINRWLNFDKAPPNIIPFARTAFGDLFFLETPRKAKSENVDLPESDIGNVYFLSMHFGFVEQVTFAMDDFFQIALSEFIEQFDQSMFSLYRRARKTLPMPSAEQCYTVPVFSIDENIKPEDIELGTCDAYESILFQTLGGLRTD
jgi:hypothetical protein